MTPLTAADRRHLAWFMLFALVVLAAGIGLRDPWPPDEPRFALIARQMVESGQWLFPRRGSELYADKPPVLMWLEAVAFTVTGQWRVAFLLPSLLAALGTLALTWDIARRLWQPRTGLVAAALLFSTLQFVEQGKRAQIDALVMFWITLGNWGILRHCLLGPHWRAFWLGCFAAGMGVITKGVGILALLMLVPCLVLAWRRWPGVLRTAGDAWRWVGGGVAFIVAVGLWLLPMLATALASNDAAYHAYVNDILFRQTAQRYAASWQHHEAWWYFGPVLLREWFPLCLLAVPMLPGWRDAWRAREARVIVPLAWVALVIVFFSLPSGKREVYVLPALPMMALAMAPFVVDLARRPTLRWLGWTLAALAGATLLAGGLWAALGHPAFAARLHERELPCHGRTVWLACAAIGAGFLAACAWWRPRRGMLTLPTGIALAWLVWGLVIYPQFNPSESTRALMRKVDDRIGPQGELALVAWREEHLLLAVRKPVEFGFTQGFNTQMTAAIAWQRQHPATRWIFTTEAALAPCVDRRLAQDLGRVNRYHWWLFPAHAVIAGCDPMRGSTETDA
jgi:4-amino-4-deoxy-L-arabinose transferase-like glycosyltransferase